MKCSLFFTMMILLVTLSSCFRTSVPEDHVSSAYDNYQLTLNRYADLLAADENMLIEKARVVGSKIDMTWTETIFKGSKVVHATPLLRAHAWIVSDSKKLALSAYQLERHVFTGQPIYHDIKSLCDKLEKMQAIIEQSALYAEETRFSLLSHGRLFSY